MISFVRNNAIYLAAAPRAINQNPILRLLALLLVLLAPARAEISGNGTPPPGAVPAEVHVARGGSAVIKFSTYGPTISVKYLIRTKPSHGRLAEVTVFDNGTGTVLYQHSGDSDSDADQFTYAAQTWRGTSAAALVKIIIDDQPARLLATEALDFGDVPLGESRTLTLKASNSGGGAAVGILSTDAPWQLASKSVYRIMAGSDLEVSVTFAPTYLGPTLGALNFSSGTGLVTALKGRGVAPFSVEPASANIAATAPRETRVKIHNLLQQPLTLEVKTPTPFTAPASLEIAAGATAELPIGLAADQLDPAEGVLELRSSAYTSSVKISADAILPKLEISSPELTFPATKISENSATILSVKNTGGRRAEVVASVPSPFELAEADRAFSLDPGAEHPLTVRFSPVAVGSAEATLVLQSGSQRLTAICRGEAALAASTPRPRLANAVMSADTSAPASDVEPEKLSQIPAIKSLDAIKINRTSVLLTWPAFNDPGLKYEVQCLDLSLDAEKNIRQQWLTIPNIEPKIKNGVATAWVTGMRTRSNLIAHVITRDAQGLPSAPSPEVRVQTTGFTWFSLKSVLFTTLAILVALIVRSKWQARHDRPAGF